MSIFLTACLVLLLSIVYQADAATLVSNCDVLIAGGSLSAFASAITSVNVSRHNGLKVHTCLLEPTDWPGGQLTSSNVPPDFGNQNTAAVNLPAAFVSLLTQVTGTWDANPGACWVSPKCFNADKIVTLMQDMLASMSDDLTVYYNTVVTDSKRDTDGRVVSLRAVTRHAAPTYSGWERTLSNDLLDWYSPHPSAFFPRKDELHFTNFDVVIEATEFGDVLMTSGNEEDVAQGMETPDENSTTLVTGCGQSFVYPFYIAYEAAPVSEEEYAAIPKGSCGQVECNLEGLTWTQTWSYRRSQAVGEDAGMYTYAQGEVSNQNLNNDYPEGYLFPPMDEIFLARKNNSSSAWSGGINMTSLANAEQRAFAWFQFMHDNAPEEAKVYLNLSRAHAGTAHGLAKVPYLRDTRRSRYGINGFRLTYADLNYSNPEDNGATAYHFEDSVAIGVYLYADIHTLDASVCTGDNSYPAYVYGHHPVNPYYVPFRALTVQSASNMLVAGKSIAQTFLANAATRLHPTEFTTGVAAGAAAALMSANGWTSTEMYNKVSLLQDILVSDYVGSPLTWTLSSAEAKQNTVSSSSSSSVVKATWLPIQYNATSYESILSLIQQLHEEGVTRVYVDVWNNGKAYFDSPTLRAIAGDAAIGQDVLQWTLQAASQQVGDKKMDVVAWFEYGLMASYGTPATGTFGSIAQSKNWLLEGLVDGFSWLDGRLPEVLSLLTGVLLDAQSKYGPLGLAGVQLDDHFAFPVALGGTTKDMNAIMTAVHDGFKSVFPSAILSLSPATTALALNTYSVDWVTWINGNYFDEVIPQIYRTTFSAFQTEFDSTLSLLNDQGKNKWAFAGLRCDGSGSPTSWSELSQMISYSADNGVDICVWYAHGILELYPEEFKTV